jgi:hypothetical protein
MQWKGKSGVNFFLKTKNKQTKEGGDMKKTNFLQDFKFEIVVRLLMIIIILEQIFKGA